MKKHWIIVLGLLFIVLGMGSMVASAEDASTTSDPAKVTAPMVVTISPEGKVLLRGKVTAVTTDTLTVEAWGMNWTVKVLSTTQVLSANKVLTDIVVDDFVGIGGDISQDGAFVIDAKVIKKWGQRPDSDKDGIPDNQDVDHNNDGKPDGEDGMGHHRGQGMFLPFMEVKGGQHDGMGKKGEGRPVGMGLDVPRPGSLSVADDNDQDGIPDSKDLDDDNDGIPDTKDSMPDDHNNDGVEDHASDSTESSGGTSGGSSSNSGSGRHGGGDN